MTPTLTEKDLISLARSKQEPGRLTRSLSRGYSVNLSVPERPDDTLKKFEESFINSFVTKDEMLQ